VRVRCSKCLYWSNHPLGITFDSNGVCSGCQVHEEKNYLDWQQRAADLRDIFRSQKLQSRYDCIIPVTGGQDSFFTVHYAVHNLGLNPLLVNFNRTFNSKEGIFNLAKLRSVFDVDFRQYSINPNVTRAVVNCTLANLGSLNWLGIAGQTSFPVRLAIQLKIPFVLWGAHQGLEQVGMFSHLESVEMTRRYRREHDLMGFDETDIFEFDPSFSKEDISSLVYPGDQELLGSGVRGIYLGNYVRWDPTDQHVFVSKTYGYKGRRSSRAYSFFDNPDCPAYFGIQDILKQIKFGYSKATDQLTREIRHGRISRTKALRIERNLLDSKPQGVREFSDWLGVSIDTVNSVLLQHSNNFASEILNGDWNKKKFKRSLYDILNQSLERGRFLDQDFHSIGKGI
jgi:N-acetyl sugar amidotransferase